MLRALPLLFIIACDDGGELLVVPAPDALGLELDLRSPPPAEDAARPDAPIQDSAVDADPRDLAEVPPPDRGLVDAAPDTLPPDAEPDAEEGPARYPEGLAHSPISPWVAARLQAIAEQDPTLQEAVFAKVGDSITVSSGFMHCFAGDAIELDGRDDLRAAIQHFGVGDAAGTSPFRRQTVAAEIGWHAGRALEGDPSPVERELDALRPRFATLMYGTNDIGFANPDRFAARMLDLVDLMVARGTIPILSTIPPRGDDRAADAEVPGYNGIIRGIAQARQVPLTDLHAALVDLPTQGLAGDGVHLSAFRDGGSRPCNFTEPGLQHGSNWRNLLTIEALHRMLEVVVSGGEAPDPAQAPLEGVGSHADPIRIDALPFSHLGDTRRGERVNALYTGCEAPQDESGPELVYTLELEAPSTIRALVLDRGDVDIDLHLLDDADDPEACLERGHTELRASLDAGTWHFVLDSWVDAEGAARAGEYLFVVVKEPD